MTNGKYCYLESGLKILTIGISNALNLKAKDLDPQGPLLRGMVFGETLTPETLIPVGG